MKYELLEQINIELGQLLFENERLRAENAELQEYRRKYAEELQAGIKHGEHMMAGWLGLILDNRITINPPTT